MTSWEAGIVSGSGVGGAESATTTLSGTVANESVGSGRKLDSVVWSVIGPE